jgi:hypothetical protein
MTLEGLFEAVVRELRARNVTFAIAGGLAADLYRVNHRLTGDVDVLLLAGDQTLEMAEEILRALSLKPAIAREADLAGGPLFAIRGGRTKPCMVVGRPEGKPHGLGVDILLPTLAWVTDAVRRAQQNPVDFGFGSVPTMLVEDVIIAKLAALKNCSSRFKDLDDLSSIFQKGELLDMPYLTGQMQRFSLALPKVVRAEAPEPLRLISRDIERGRRGCRGGAL